MDNAIIETLGLKPGMSTYFAHAPAEYFDKIGAHYRTRLTDEDGMYDFMHAFFSNTEQLNASAPIFASKLGDGGILWISWKTDNTLAVSSEYHAVPSILKKIGMKQITSAELLQGWQSFRFEWK